MSSSIQNLDHLKIPLEDILAATNHFSDKNFIRQGGFGKIYYGKLKRSGELIDIVARRLDTKYGHGSKEFWTEVSMLSSLKHENLVSIVGFCDEKNEKIVINKYEARGSLENYLSDPDFTWGMRLNVCAGIAHALSYIHYDEKRDFSVIHRNLKSSKILLDAKWKPKLSGFELSMTTVASQRDRLCIEDPCGTTGYVDPTYARTGTVTHKSDMYSFGVVLFEVFLCKKAITDKRDIKLAKEAKSRFENEQLDLPEHTYGQSFKVFSQTAYDCLREHREDRPSIDKVFRKLENAISICWYEKKIRKLTQKLRSDNTRLKRPSEKESIYLDLRLCEAEITFLMSPGKRLNFEVSERKLPAKDFFDRYSQMPNEFVVQLIHHDEYPEELILPDAFEEEAYNGNNFLYLSGLARNRKKVSIFRNRFGVYRIRGKVWDDFVEENLNDDIKILHFIEEGDDSFYVIGYGDDGKQIGGYGDGNQGYIQFQSRVSPYQDLGINQVTLADIKRATQDFHHDNLIGKGGFGQVYKGELLSARGDKIIAAKRLDRMSDQGETELMTECVILSKYKHMNVINLVSYCNEKGEKVIVYDYASRGSLDKWLKRKELTWRKRLEICIDIARGLDFLHGTSDVKQEVVIHRDIKSANILLHDDWKASIADFGLSLISPINQDINFVIDNVKGTQGYCDPQYISTGFLTKESDIYSFGVLLFEMLCGRFVIENKNCKAKDLVYLVRHQEGTLYEMVFEATKKQMAAISLTKFQNIAYQCIHEERSKRPTACDVLIQLKRALKIQEKWEDLKTSLDDIMLDTQDFSHDNLIGKGDSWSLYKGRVTCADGCEMIATKRLDRLSDQRETERMAELEILLEYTNENIISLEGYCNEKGEEIMVYEFASISKGSLDRWLKYDGLTWRKRLEICIDIARGLAFLHGTSHEKQEVVIHGDIKSANVLLNDDWKAKIADFGQSLISSINQKRKYVVNNAKGTSGYCDPLYTTTGVLTKESDIYSLGVLFFEMLCGRSVMEDNSSRAHNLIHLVRDRFEEGTLYELVFEATKKQMVPASLTAFQSIAYQCIQEEREKRPTAEDLLIQLKKALEFQEVMERLIQMTDSPEIYHVMNNTDLYTWPNKGFLHRDNKVMFSFGTYGMVETVSATEFQFKSYYRPNKWRTLSKSRFGEVVQISDSSSMNIQISVKTQLLSPGVNYGVYLVYKFCSPIDESTTRTHKLAIKMGSEDLFPEFTTRRDNDGWMRIELYRFSNLKEEANFDAFLMGFSEDPFQNVAIYVEGVEFRPISNMTREEIEELEKVSITIGGGSIVAVKDSEVWFWVTAILGCLLFPCLVGAMLIPLVLLCPCLTCCVIFGLYKNSE